MCLKTSTSRGAYIFPLPISPIALQGEINPSISRPQLTCKQVWAILRPCSYTHMPLDLGVPPLLYPMVPLLGDKQGLVTHAFISKGAKKLGQKTQCVYRCHPALGWLPHELPVVSSTLITTPIPSPVSSRHQHQGSLLALNIQFPSPSPPCERVQHSNEPAGLPVPCFGGMCLGGWFVPASCRSGWQQRRATSPSMQPNDALGTRVTFLLASCSPVHALNATQGPALPASLS